MQRQKKPAWLIEKERSAGKRIKPWQVAIWITALFVALAMTIGLAHVL